MEDNADNKMRCAFLFLRWKILMLNLEFLFIRLGKGASSAHNDVVRMKLKILLKHNWSKMYTHPFLASFMECKQVSLRLLLE